MSAEGIKDSEFDVATEIKPGDTLTGLQDEGNKRFSPQMVADLHKGGGFLLAKLINVNLKDEVDIPLEWEGDYDATNTIPFKAIVIPKAGAFAQKGLDAVFATTFLGALTCPGTGQIVSLKLNGQLAATFPAGNNGGSASAFFTNDVKPALQSVGYIVDDTNYPVVSITHFQAGSAANGGVLTLSIIPKTPATTKIFFNGNFRGFNAQTFAIGQILGYINIFSDGPASDDNLDDFMDAMKNLLQSNGNANLGVVDNRPAENSFDMTAPLGTGAEYNGFPIRISDEDSNPFLTPDPSAAFSGGVDGSELFLATSDPFSGGADATPATQVAIKYCGENIWIDGFTLEAIIEALVTDENIASGRILNADTGKPIYKRLGDWVVSRLVGTLNDYFVDIYIFGEKMPELIPVP